MIQYVIPLLVALITGGMTLIGTIMTIHANSRKAENDLKISRAVTNEKLENLTQEVRRHNNFAERIPVLESKVNAVEKRIERLEEEK